MGDEELIASLEAAVVVSPDDVHLRLHLADLLVEAGRFSDASSHYMGVLSMHPDDVRALCGAGLTAELLHRPSQAAAYRHLANLLSSESNDEGQLSARTADTSLEKSPVDASEANPAEPVSKEAEPVPLVADEAEHSEVELPIPEVSDLDRIEDSSDDPSSDIEGPAADPVPVALSPRNHFEIPEFVPGAGMPESEEYDDFLRQLVEKAEAELGRPAITLADVGGLDSVKQRIQSSFLGPARNPKLRRIYGTTLQGGLLLYGPPGCGKTYIAKALAGELGARFSSVGINDILDMWLGNSEKALHETFEKARQNTPCVLFLDEIDALGMKRSNLARSSGRGVVVQLLTELDGAHGNNDGLFVLGATNQPWDVDPALRRPGRFDRTVLVLPPDRAARRTIISLQMKDRLHEDIDIEWIAARTEGFSGADLRLLCNAAAEAALSDSITSSTNRPISQSDFKAVLSGIRPSTRPWFDAARNFAMFAKENGDYDELLNYMRQHKLR